MSDHKMLFAGIFLQQEDHVVKSKKNLQITNYDQFKRYIENNIDLVDTFDRSN